MRLIYAFDMRVGGAPLSVSLAGVEFESGATELTYTEQGFFLAGDYGAEARLAGQMACWISLRLTLTRCAEPRGRSSGTPGARSRCAANVAAEALR